MPAGEHSVPVGDWGLPAESFGAVATHFIMAAGPRCSMSAMILETSGSSFISPRRFSMVALKSGDSMVCIMLCMPGSCCKHSPASACLQKPMPSYTGVLELQRQMHVLSLTSMIFCPKPWAICMNWGFWNISDMAEAAAVGSMSAGLGAEPGGAALSWPPAPCIELCRAADICAKAGS